MQRTFFPYREDPNFWHALTRNTFRISDQPLPQDIPWHSLYRKLATQTRLYTWGADYNGNLGHRIPDIRDERGRPNLWDRNPYRGVNRPRPALLDGRVGIVVDVQCGGWSTTVLNSIGAIFMFGHFDDNRRYEDDSSCPRRLSFPPAYPQTTKSRYEPSTAIRQYSTGRSGILGLADDNNVWMWVSDTGFQVKPMHVDLIENKVRRVVAGFDSYSMYVRDVGIVFWLPTQDSGIVRGGRQEALVVADMMLVDSVTIPGTSQRRSRAERSVDPLESYIGEVTNHIVLEHYIVFSTHLNQVFCYPTRLTASGQNLTEPIELTTFYGAAGSGPFRIRDIQGAFTHFAIFLNDGSILTAKTGLLDLYLNAYINPSDDTVVLPSPTLVPITPSHKIVSFAFGDYHYHTLNSNGTITSYGHEPHGCGGLGLGADLPSPSQLRGLIKCPNPTHNMCLPGGEGRSVWFEPLMATWLADAHSTSLDDDEFQKRQHAGHERTRKAYADYFENKGAKWEETVTKDGEMGAYFVLKVAAAGWSSAALVLVDDEKAERARQAHIRRPEERAPSPALSIQSADSYEHVESPGEQLTNELYAVYVWFWELGRWFLGLTERDARRGEESGKEEGRVEYTWSRDPFPRLGVEDGIAVAGEGS